MSKRLFSRWLTIGDTFVSPKTAVAYVMSLLCCLKLQSNNHGNNPIQKINVVGNSQNRIT